MTASDVAAWWGAGVATLVLGWDIYKWATAGARLILKTSTNMQLVGDSTEALHIFVEVVNRGDRPATITHLAFYSYKSLFRRIARRRNGHVAIVPQPGGSGLPFELGPGQRWVGITEQDAVFAQHPDELVYAVVSHSGSNKESLCRVQRPA